MPPAENDEELTLTVGGRAISGWTSVRVTRGLEIMPSSFEIGMTEVAPDNAQAMVVKPGDPCVVSLGNDPVITGYVDRVIPALGDTSHGVRVVGRSKSSDLVDSAAEWPGGQISGSSALEIAKKLAAPYGITVEAAVDTGAAIPQFNLTVTETGYAIIERVCRWRGLLIYDLPNGNITLAQAGSTAMASGLKEGENFFFAEATYSMDERFSDYEVFLQSMDVLGDAGGGGNLLATEKDPGVPRHRLKSLIAEAGGGGLDIAKQRAKWEAARRAGRGYKIESTVDTWRDSAGKLWEPNATLPVDAPTLHHPSLDWTIGQVTFFLNEDRGTGADLLIMPRAAFLPEPILILPFPPDVLQ